MHDDVLRTGYRAGLFSLLPFEMNGLFVGTISIWGVLYLITTVSLSAPRSYHSSPLRPREINSLSFFLPINP